MPAVSVIIPAYNGGPRLHDAVTSVLGQTFFDLELVVVDDGGSEDLSWLSHVDERVRLISQQNAGVSAARNVGADSTDAPLIAYLDQDDRWAPEKLFLQLRALGDAVLSHTDFFWCGLEKTLGHHDKGPITRAELLAGGHFCLSSLLVRREAVERVGGFRVDLAMQQDFDIGIKLLALGTASHVAKPLVDYVLHHDNASSNYRLAHKERVAVIRENADKDEAPLARTGVRAGRELYGAQALQAFRRTRSPGDLVRAAAWSPGHVAASCAGKIRGLPPLLL